MPPIPRKMKKSTLSKSVQSKCVACEGTGKDSRKGVCFPCQGKGYKR